VAADTTGEVSGSDALLAAELGEGADRWEVALLGYWV